jgi:hypothetical protein
MLRMHVRTWVRSWGGFGAGREREREKGKERERKGVRGVGGRERECK